LVIGLPNISILSALMKHNLLDKSERKKLFTDIKEVSEPLFEILKEIETKNSLLKVYQKLLFS
jgi:hypothetical protein